MANLARYTFTTAQTGLVIREVYQNSGAMLTNTEYFIAFVKDGVEYTDIVIFATAGDQTTLNTGVTSGHYLTFTLTPGTTINDGPAGSAVTLV